MATRKSLARSRPVAALVAFARFVLIALFTGVETIALGVWLALVQDASLVSQASVVGLSILAGGLVLEHFLTDLAVNGLDASIPGGEAITFSLTETALWALWLAVAEAIGGIRGILVAGILLAVLLVPQHTIEDNVLRGRDLDATLLDLNTLDFSVIEAAGATAWLVFVVRGEAFVPVLAAVDESVFGDLASVVGISDVATVDPALVGLALLAVALFVEHNVGVSFSRRP
jgi:hypothetical protein